MPTFWDNPDNLAYFLHLVGQPRTDGYAAPRLSTYPTRGICPHCGSQGCPHCADTDELTVLPPNDFDSWADLIDSPIVTKE